jgi:hypothetical protein
MSGTDDELLHDAVAHALGFDVDEVTDLIEEKPPEKATDFDDGSALNWRLRILSNGGRYGM